jgi:branched-chain amino acid transport system substrate-binding protein
LARAFTALCAAALVLAGCGDDDDEPHRIAGDVATVYSSTPRHGVSAAEARAVRAGERRALAERDGRAGGLRIRLRQLPATDGDADPWDPELVSENASRAADDPTAIAYIGELDYGGSAVSLPITNGAGLLQVSPGDGLTSLTRTPPGRPRSGPERLYPSGERTFVRVGPTDLQEAELLVERLSATGLRRVALVYDREIYGRELAAQLADRARRAGLTPVGSEEYRGRLDEIQDIAQGLAEAEPDAIVHAGVSGPGTGRLLAAIDRLAPGVPLFATSGILSRRAPILAAPLRVEAVGPPLEAERAGHRAMRLVLDAIDSGGRDRRRVIAAALRLARPAGDGELVLYSLIAGRFSPR